MSAHSSLKRTRSLLIAFGLASAWPLFGQAFTVTDLGTLGGSESQAFAINGCGQVVGSSALAGEGGAAVHAFLWKPTQPNGIAGSMHDLGTLGGASGDSFAKDINDEGLVVGYFSPPGGADMPGNRAFFWQPATPRATSGQMFPVEGLEQVQAGAYGINSAGDIVGGVQVGEGQWRPFVYRDAENELTTLPILPGATRGGALDINDAREIVGFSEHGEEPCASCHRAIRWRLQALAGPPVHVITQSLWAWSQALAIDNQVSGVVVGDAGDSAGAPLYSPHRGFRYENDGSGLPALANLGHASNGSEFIPYGVLTVTHPSSQMWIVGQAGSAAYLNSLNLNQQVLFPAPFTSFIEARGVNRLGQIVGTGQVDNGDWHAFLLTRTGVSRPAAWPTCW